MKPNELIIIGGGASINEARPFGLEEKIKDCFTCGLNYAYRYFNCTFHCYVDRDFYNKQYIELSKLKLIIGKEHCQKIHSNTITLPTATRYWRDLKGGVYSPGLVGLFALTLGIYLLEEGTIYLLGYDFGEVRSANYEDKSVNELKNYSDFTKKDDRGRWVTHFYQGDFEHRGIGKTNYYNARNRAKNKFGAYKNEKRVKIYNVSPNSRIPNDILEKINYNTFFSKLTSKKYDQVELRKFIRKKLNS